MPSRTAHALHLPVLRVQRYRGHALRRRRYFFRGRHGDLHYEYDSADDVWDVWVLYRVRAFSFPFCSFSFFVLSAWTDAQWMIYVHRSP